MAVTDQDVENHLSAMWGLLPQGLIWARRSGAISGDGVRERVLRGLAAEGAYLCDRAQQLLIESDPRTTDEMLPDWEEALGLPEIPVTDPNQQPSPEQRRAAVAQKYSAKGGASVQDMIDAAAAVGFTITIIEGAYGMADCVNSGCTDPIGGPGWYFVWQVIGPVTTVQYAGIGDGCDNSLVTWGNAALEGALLRAKPAWTQVEFFYTA